MFPFVYLFLSLEEKELETNGVIFRIFVFAFCCVYIFIIKRKKKEKKEEKKRT